MKLFLVQARHFRQQKLRTAIHRTSGNAHTKAAAFVNAMLMDSGMRQDADPFNWEQRLDAVREKNVDIACDVTISEHGLLD